MQANKLFRLRTKAVEPLLKDCNNLYIALPFPLFVALTCVTKLFFVACPLLIVL